MAGRHTGPWGEENRGSEEAVETHSTAKGEDTQEEERREEHTKKVIEEVAERMEQWDVTMNAYREERRMLRVCHEETEREAKRVRVEDVKEVMKAHREGVQKAIYAGSTPDIDMREVAKTDTISKTPVTSSKRTRGTDAHFWIPRANTEVRVFWAGIEGAEEYNKVKGTWHSARTANTEWPKEQGIPGVYLEYTDGIVEWTAMDLFGDTIQIIPTMTKKMKHNTKDKKETGSGTGIYRNIPRGSYKVAVLRVAVEGEVQERMVPGTGRCPGMMSGLGSTLYL